MTSRTLGGRLNAGKDGAPSLVVLGAPRCGTTALANWLRDAGLGVGVKDSFYLMDDDAGLRGPSHVSTDGIEGYLKLFSGSVEPTAEVAAGYLYQRTALDFFQQWEEPPHFAVVLRDPVARLRSVHRYFSGNLGLLPRDMDFDAYVEALFADAVPLPDQTVAGALGQGRYAEAIEPWVAAFGADRVHVYAFDEMEQAPDRIVAELLETAGCPARISLDAYEFEAYNNSFDPRSKALAKATAWGRRWMPSGRLRSWGGEKLRRLQSRKAVDPGSDRSTTITLSGTEQRLSDYYRSSNAALADVHRLDTRGWA